MSSLIPLVHMIAFCTAAVLATICLASAIKIQLRKSNRRRQVSR